MPPQLAQRLIELVCQPQDQGNLPLMLAQTLTMGLDGDFCLWSIALGQPWFWAGTGKEGRWEGKEFVQTLNQDLGCTQRKEEKEFLLTPEDLPDLQSVLGKNCQEAVAITTYFQGDCNGLVIVGYFQKEAKINKKNHSLTKLQTSLGIINQLVLTTQLKVSNPFEKVSLSTETNFSSISPSASVRNPFEESTILKTWYDASRQQLEQQRQWNQQLINNIITVMSDQTRNPLATIRMGIEILQKNPPTPEKLQQRLEIIKQEWQKLNSINREILHLRELKQEKNIVRCQTLDILPLLKNIISSQKIISKRISLNYLVQNYGVEANTDHLQQIFQELLTNAQKFSIADSLIKVSLNNDYQTVAQAKQMVTLTFANLTPTVDSKNIKYFFEPFYREQSVIDGAIAGIGLGLTITRILVEQLNGRIDVAVESATIPGQSVITFTLLIPGSGAS